MLNFRHSAMLECWGTVKLSALSEAVVRNGGRGNFKTGSDFEEWVGRVLRLDKAKFGLKNGEEVTRGVAGSRIPDYDQFLGGLLEVKMTGNALKKPQFVEFVRYSENEGKPLTYLFLEKPSDQKIRLMSGWLDEMGSDLTVGVKYLVE